MSFDIDECLASGVFICGAPGCGKTGLAMNMAKMLAENNVVLYIVDPTHHWMDKFRLVRNIRSMLTPPSICESMTK